MKRRDLLILLACCSFSGCATMSDDFVDAAPRSAMTVGAPAMTPDQIYEAGALDLVRGDSEAARRKWELCVSVAPADSDARLNCMVGLEKLVVASSAQPSSASQ